MPLLEEPLILGLLARARFVPRLRVGDEARAVSALRALERAGFRAFLVDPVGTGPPAGVFAAFRGEPFLPLGAGLLVTADQIREAAELGAAWGVLPGPEEELLEAGRKAGLLLAVRVRRPGDAWKAREMGASCLLLAPPMAGKWREEGEGGGEPLPSPGGTLLAWEGPWAAPPPPGTAFQVVTSGLFPPVLLAQGRFRELEGLARECLAWRSGSSAGPS